LGYCDWVPSSGGSFSPGAPQRHPEGQPPMLHCSKPENMPSHKGVKAIFVQCTKNFQARAGGREEREIESLEEVLTAGDKDFRARHIAEVGIAELIDSARDLLGPAHALERN